MLHNNTTPRREIYGSNTAVRHRMTEPFQAVSLWEAICCVHKETDALICSHPLTASEGLHAALALQPGDLDLRKERLPTRHRQCHNPHYRLNKHSRAHDHALMVEFHLI